MVCYDIFSSGQFEESSHLGGTGHRFWSAVVFIEEEVCHFDL